MQRKRVFVPLILGLGLTLALIWLLSGTLPPVYATDINVQTTRDGVADDRTCTLREAIIAANTDAWVDACAPGNGADYIALGEATYVLTVAGSGENSSQSGDLDIAGPLVIEGAGPGLTIIDANGLDRVIEVRPGAGTVVISGVTLINGSITANGGGIFNFNADLTLVNVEIKDCAALGSGGTEGRGGGIYVFNGNITLDGVRIATNSAAQRGGGVYISEGHVTLDNGGQILSNTASYAGGGVVAYFATAIFTQTGDSVIAANVSQHGGGIYLYKGSATLLQGEITSNTATIHGGGVNAYQTGARFTMSGGQISCNRGLQRGGGIYLYHEAGATMSGGEVVYNVADDGGGVYVNASALTQTGGLVAYNLAHDHGGGYYLSVADSTAILIGAQVISNSADVGGGIHVNDGHLNLTNTTLGDNRATSGNGGGIFSNNGLSELIFTTVAHNTASGSGEGIYRGGGTVRLTDTIVADNGTTNCSGTIVSQGHNLDSGTSCGLGASGDITDSNPLLGALREIDGSMVYPLRAGSPAIGAGICIPGIETDQRGLTRPQGDGCDIGAYEWQVVVYMPLVMR